MMYEISNAEEAGGVLKRIEEWLIRHIPAQRKKNEQLQKTLSVNSSRFTRKFDDLPKQKQKDLMKDPVVAAMVMQHKREVERRDANH